MAAPVAWYLDFAKWRLRRSELKAVKLYLCPGASGLQGKVVFWELRTIAMGLGFVGATWSLHSWWRRYEGKAVAELMQIASIGSDDILLSVKSARARAQGGVCPAQDIELQQEMVVSTRALLALLARWA